MRLNVIIGYQDHGWVKERAYWAQAHGLKGSGGEMSLKETPNGYKEMQKQNHFPTTFTLSFLYVCDCFWDVNISVPTGPLSHNESVTSWHRT